MKERIPTYTLLKPERIFCSTADETFWRLWGKTGVKTWSIDYFLCSTTKHLDDSDVYVSPVHWITVSKSLYMHHYSLNFPCYSFTDLRGERRPRKADPSCYGYWDGYPASLLPLPCVPLKNTTQTQPENPLLLHKSKLTEYCFMSEVTFTTHCHDQGRKHKAELFKQTTTFPSNKPCFSNNLQW